MTSRLSGLERQDFEKTAKRVDVLGVQVDDISFNKAVEKILELSKEPKSGHFVVTVNAEFVMLARKNKEFAKILSLADIAVADGISVAVSKLIGGGNYQERIAGVDLLEKLCERACENAITIGFLGGFGDVAERVAKRQKVACPNLIVKLVEAGNPNPTYDLRLREKVRQIGRIDILFVAYGMGQQEVWIARNRHKMNVGVFIGVGGAFDYLAGVKKRAPRLMQNTGLEWLWRLAMEPSRIWRMRVLPVFMVMVISKKLLRNPF